MNLRGLENTRRNQELTRKSKNQNIPLALLHALIQMKKSKDKKGTEQWNEALMKPHIVTELEHSSQQN